MFGAASLSTLGSSRSHPKDSIEGALMDMSGLARARSRTNLYLPEMMVGKFKDPSPT